MRMRLDAQLECMENLQFSLERQSVIFRKRETWRALVQISFHNLFGGGGPKGLPVQTASSGGGRVF